ncbi:hypothetical protein HPB49_022272 [Dermacentor silvarum]|uniref:Uncharacterized protein n=1 Tax=Dermacentor silvarum TaxID=543639 RepID=A0ACB8DLN0_DERSI|nr:hypothetical protein HPB49_022272 [Dermacentor silvarum]
MKFGGSPLKSLPFWDLFRRSVHANPLLNNVDRLHYVRSLLDGPAAKAVVGILTTDSSYEDAISILRERFGGVRIIEQKHLGNLRTLRPVAMSSNVSALRSLYDFVQINIRGLKELVVSESNYAAMLCNLADLRSSVRHSRSCSSISNPRQVPLSVHLAYGK